MKAANTAEVLLYDAIGPEWAGMICAQGFASALKAMGDISQIDVRINSPGGAVFEGMAIYNTLANHPANVTVHIDGLAASIATIIAMAGDKINMAENAMFMIHEPSGVQVGTSASMLEMAGLLEKLTNSSVDVYASRSKQDPVAIRTAMTAETWYTAAEAKAAGFVDAITPNKQIAAEFDSKQFEKAPAWAQERLRQLSMKLEPQMADKPEEKIDLDAIKAQAKAEERERQTKIHALCAQAKQPEKAAAFCEDESITVADVQAKLFDALCKSNGPLGDEGGTANDTHTDDGNDKYRAEFKAHSYSMTEDEYISMRRIDDGIDKLQSAKK